MKKVCVVSASPLSLQAFMRNHVLHLAARYEVIVVANFSSKELRDGWLSGVRLVSVPIERKISIWADLYALTALVRLFRGESFDVVHSITPKAGLLAMIASKMVGVPHRLHCFTGQVWATRKGLGRFVLKTADCVVAANANHILADSVSQCKFLESESVVPIGVVNVLGKGSISGVDLERFRPDKLVRMSMRKEWGVPENACLLLFVGRLNQDKGIFDLARAFSRLANGRKDIWLVVVGHDETGIRNEFEQLCGNSISYVRIIDFTSTPEYAMSAADVIALPSYREGFGNVIIEAAACGIPAVASRIYGLVDAIEENVTGLMHAPGDVSALCDCLRRLCDDSDLRLKMGETARARVSTHFSMRIVTNALLAYYDKLFRVR